MSTTQPDAAKYPDIEQIRRCLSDLHPEYDIANTIKERLPALLTELESLRAEKAANAGLVAVGRATINHEDDPNFDNFEALDKAIASYRASREKGASHA